MQLKDFQLKNGPYRESTFAMVNSQLDQSRSKKEPTVNKDLLKERLSLLREIIEIEQISKNYLDQFKRHFVSIFEMAKHEVLHMLLVSGF